MQIEIIDLDQLRLYQHNAKLHPQRQIEQIKNSIQEFGNNDPIAIDENNVVIEGNGRLMALRQLGRTETAVIRLSGLTEQQKKAYALAHNKLTMNTGFDLETLRREIEAIKTVDLGPFDLDIQIDDPPVERPETEKELISFVLSLTEEQYQMLTTASDYIENSVDSKSLHRFGNPNKRNNLIFEVIYQWAEQKKLL